MEAKGKRESTEPEGGTGHKRAQGSPGRLDRNEALVGLLTPTTSRRPVMILACWCWGEKLELDGSLPKALGNTVLLYSDLIYLSGAITFLRGYVSQNSVPGVLG